MSPIIATILLVAITVVLAAVLYVLISGLTKTGASTPYQLGMAEYTATSASGSYYVTLSLSPTSGLATGLFGLTVVNAAQVTQATAAAPAGCKANVAYATATCTSGTGWYGVLVYSNNTIAATYAGTSAAWAYAAGTTTISLNGGFTLIVVSNALYDGAGYTITAYGTGTSSVSGSANL